MHISRRTRLWLDAHFFHKREIPKREVVVTSQSFIPVKGHEIMFVNFGGALEGQHFTVKKTKENPDGSYSLSLVSSKH